MAIDLIKKNTNVLNKKLQMSRIIEMIIVFLWIHM